MKPDSSRDMNSVPSKIADFYAGKSVFITGGTGFLGLVVIEKLLYACTEINKIYVLVRDKKGLSAKSRIGKCLDQPLFSRLKNERPEDLCKLIPITGDIAESELGLKPDDKAMLIEEVSIVIHSAATLKFNDPLKSTLKLNFEGTQQVLNLCKHLKKIHSFVHISTAYSNPDKPVIKEVIYPPPAELSDAYKFAEIENNPGVDQITKFLNGHPNWYTFTKSLTETFIHDNHGDIPTAIVRPSIISASYHEPVEGWLSNWNGATGLVTAVGKGVNRVMLGSEDNILDLVPVDYVSNLTIAAAAACSRLDGVKMYNCCTSYANPLTIGGLFKEIRNYNTKHRFNDFPYPTLYFTKSKWMVTVMTFLMQTCTAFLADMWLRITCKKAKFLKMNSQVIMVRDVLEIFTSNSWEMHSENSLALFTSLSPSDQELFPFDLTDIVWTQYISTYISGISTYLLKKK